MEIYAPLYRLRLKKPLARLKRIQTILGEMHDGDVWIATVTLMLVAERSDTRTTARLKRQEAGRISQLKMFLSSREKEWRRLHRRFCYLGDSLSRAAGYGTSCGKHLTLAGGNATGFIPLRLTLKSINPCWFLQYRTRHY